MYILAAYNYTVTEYIPKDIKLTGREKLISSTITRDMFGYAIKVDKLSLPDNITGELLPIFRVTRQEYLKLTTLLYKLINSDEKDYDDNLQAMFSYIESDELESLDNKINNILAEEVQHYCNVNSAYSHNASKKELDNLYIKSIEIMNEHNRLEKLKESRKYFDTNILKELYTKIEELLEGEKEKYIAKQKKLSRERMTNIDVSIE